MTDDLHPDPHSEPRGSDNPQGGAALQAQLEELLDGRLDEAAADALRARIEQEPAVGETWEELRRIQALVRGYGPAGAELEVPADFLAGVRSRIRAAADDAPQAAAAPQSATSRRRPGRMLRMLTVAYAAAALLVVGFTVRYVMETEDRGAASETETARTEPLDKSQLEDRESGPAMREGARREQPVADALERESRGRLAAGNADEPVQPAAPDAPAPAETAAPGAKTQPGVFGQPGGAVKPGARPPPGAKSRASGGIQSGDEPLAGAADADADAEQEQAETARRAGPASAASARGERVYVLEVADLEQARRELTAVLGDASILAFTDTGAGRAPRDTAAPATEKSENEDGADEADDDGLLPRGGKARSKADDKEPRAAASLYRVDAVEAGRILAALRTPAAAAGTAKTKRRPDAGADASRVRLLKVLSRELDAASWDKLEARAVDGVWSGAAMDRLRKKGAAPVAAPTPAPATPTAPGAPAGPAPRKPDAAEPAPSKPAADAPEAKAKRLRTRAGDAQPVRVRILLLERR